ncbi:MAG: kelch repeat-containing protein [Kofleriaceae bacterium]
MNVKWLGLATLVACSSPAPLPDAPSSPWSLGPPLPSPRLEPGVTALGQRVAVVGGFDSDQQAGLDVTTHADVLDTFTMKWSALPDAPVARHHVQLAAVGATLYLLGGLDGAPDASMNYPARGDCYALDTGEAAPAWRAIATMPVGLERGSAAVVVAPPRIYLFGGASTTDALASNLVYDITTNTWLTDAVPDLPAKRSHPAAMRRVDGGFAVVGGLSGLASDTAQSDVYLLPTGASAWTNGVAMPEQRGGCAHGVIQSKLICAGGEAGTSALDYTQAYDPIENLWSDLDAMPERTAGTLGAVVGQRMFIPGGARHLVFEPTDTLYIFAPLDTASARELGAN